MAPPTSSTNPKKTKNPKVLPIRKRPPTSGSFKPGHAKVGGRKKGTPNYITAEMKKFFSLFMESDEYKTSLAARILEGKAIPIEQLGLHHVVGKPPDKVEIESPSIARLLELSIKESLRKKKKG